MQRGVEAGMEEERARSMDSVVVDATQAWTQWWWM
jgi:hypothetical protein